MCGVEPAAAWEGVAGLAAVVWFAPASEMKTTATATAMRAPSAVISVPSLPRNRGARGMLCGVDMVCSVWRWATGRPEGLMGHELGESTVAAAGCGALTARLRRACSPGAVRW